MQAELNQTFDTIDQIDIDIVFARDWVHETTIKGLTLVYTFVKGLSYPARAERVYADDGPIDRLWVFSEGLEFYIEFEEIESADISGDIPILTTTEFANKKPKIDEYDEICS